MSESPSPLLCDSCLKGIHHELQVVENCACPCSNVIRDEHTII
jgi:hypothetical protein